MKLTLKQQRFADEYIISGNATQSAIKAGYSKKTAGVTGGENLKKPYIQDYIEKKLKELDDEKTMSLKEAIERSTSIARGEIQTGYSKAVNRLTGRIEKEILFEYTPRLEEQQRSLEHLLRCNGAFTDKVDVTQRNIEITIGDWEDES